ncbi:MAG: hypothetical protein IGR93_15705 [Hydrococcus sp. C42_A2020_068]|nr:hypothetical protein [Hydrococcus sp. C42_A2020_068]
MTKTAFLYPYARYHGEFTPENLENRGRACSHLEFYREWRCHYPRSDTPAVRARRYAPAGEEAQTFVASAQAFFDQLFANLT